MLPDSLTKPNKASNVTISEQFGSKCLQRCPVTPRIQRKACLPASLLQKGFSIPPVFDRYLRQQQASPAIQRNQQTVAPYFDLLGSNGL